MTVEWGYAATLLVAAGFSIAIGRTALQRHESPGSGPLAALMAAITVWSVIYALHWLRVPAPSTYFWVDGTYLGVVTIPIALLAFALEFTNREKWLTPRRVAWLALPQVITVLALWTDHYHHLFFGDVVRDPAVGNIFDGGIIFWGNVIYSYGMIAFGLFLLLQAYIQSRGLYRQQLTAILVGALVPLATNVASVLQFNPIPELDLTPIAFTITGAFFAFALFRLGLLDVVPVARYTLVEEMSDGVLVLDSQNRVVDINPAAEDMLSIQGKAPIGVPAIELLNPWPDIRAKFEGEFEASQQITLPGEEKRTLDLRISSLHSRTGLLKGRLIIMRDISQQVRIQQQLERANKRLQKQIEQVEELQAKLREQAIRDSLTGLFNRRYLEETLIREIAKVQRDGQQLSVAMLDVDNFKTFNDNYGHAAGDLMLQALAGLLMQNTRTSDIVCRYGGEEFVVGLPGADTLVAFARIEYIRGLFENRLLEFEGKEMSSTVSAGVAGFPINGETYEELLDAADQGMYLAKKKGGNQVMPLTAK